MLDINDAARIERDSHGKSADPAIVLSHAGIDNVLTFAGHDWIPPENLDQTRPCAVRSRFAVVLCDQIATGPAIAIEQHEVPATNPKVARSINPVQQGTRLADPLIRLQ
jgi:hypothetical protein